MRRVQHSSARTTHLYTWRITTAIRVFALALAVGTVLGDGRFVESVPMVVVLALVAALTSLLEWSTRDHPTYWLVVGEAVVVPALVVSTQSMAEFGAYLAVPPIVAGVRHGIVTTLNVTLLSWITVATSLAADPTTRSLEGLGQALPWLLIGPGVGSLASWQSRSTRDLAARQAPYAAAHHLMVRIHHLATSGNVGLDSGTLATDLDTAMRRVTGGARSTIFMVEPDQSLRALNAGQDADRLAQEIAVAPEDRTPGAAVVALRGAQQVLGYCVVVGVPRWTQDLDNRTQEVADEFAVRLDTALLFDEVRSLATSEERNRIAREMHDGVAQEIVGLGYIVDEIESISEQEQTRELASALRDEITRLVSEIRFSIFDLRHQVAEGGLASSLADYAHEVSHSSGLRVHLTLAESGPPLPRRIATETLRVAQEAMSNVRKHAGARNLWVSFESDGRNLHLRVEDDGVGNAEPRDHHWGLQTMHERAAGMNARLEVAPRVDGGTVVTLATPTTLTPEGDTAHGHHRATG